MFELISLSPILALFLTLTISGVISFAFTQLFKNGMKSYLKSTPEKDKEPWWFNPLIRLTAILIASVVGFAMTITILGTFIGTCGGALNTLIVRLVRSRLKRASESLGSSPLNLKGKDDNPPTKDFDAPDDE